MSTAQMEAPNDVGFAGRTSRQQHLSRPHTDQMSRIRAAVPTSCLVGLVIRPYGTTAAVW